MEVGDDAKTKQQLIDELAEMRRLVAVLEESEVRRAQTERALERERDFTSQVVNGIDAIVCGLSPDGTTRYINATGERITGYRSEELLGRNWWEKFYPGDEYRQVEELFRAFQQGDVRDYAMTLTTRTGEKRSISWCSINRCDEHGEIIDITGVGVDLTERQRADLMARQLAAIVESSDDAIYSKDLEGRITSWNGGAERLYGYTAAETVGQPVSMLLPAGHVNEVPSILGRLRRGERVERYESIRRRKDGSLVTVSLRVSPIRNSAGCVVGASAIARDITQRLRMEQTVRESEARYRMLFDTIPHGIREVDLSGRIVACNPAYERMLEYGPGELIGRSMPDLIAEEDRDRVRGLLERVAAEHPPPRRYLARTLTKSGRVIEGEVTWNYVRNDRGSVTGMVAVVTDVTDRKRAERAVADEQRLLRQMLDLYERDRQLLAYEIHDGAAQHVTGALFHLQGFEQLRTTNPAAAEESIERARQSLTEAAGEIRRLIGGLRPPILDESGVVAAVEHLVDESRRAGGAEIEIVQDVRFERLATPVENTIFRIVQEGLTNARRYSQSDRIRVSLVQNNGTVHVEIRDWGVGFDPNKVSRSRFGLRGIRERARLLGGRAEISSQPGEGTRIKVELPCVLPGEESGSED